jgi:protein-S-isoprenylcysteine O-methyltransferase Ste14
MANTTIEPLERASNPKGWTYPGVIVLTCVAMMIVMALDIWASGNIGMISNVGVVIVGLIAAMRVRKSDYQVGIWVVPIAWTVAILTTGQFAPMRGGSFLREQVLHIAYGLAMHAWWILGATALSAAVAIFRRGRRP